jgi:hypothetical protein
MRLSQIARAAGVIMQNFLMLGLHSQSGLVRKGSAFLLRAPKRLARRRAQPADYASSPPVLVNSIPKSGTHLLDQIVGAIPSTRNYGEFISSMTSSFRFQRQAPEHACRRLQGAVPSELVRAHLFYSDDVAATLQRLRFVHYFIYRDPRDVVVSEALYYRRINRWHRLHTLFRDAASDGEAILMAIKGLADQSFYFPDIGARLDHYSPWINQPAVHAIRFEDLISAERVERIRDLMTFYAASTHASAAIDDLCNRAVAAIAPAKSHTYRSGKSGGWRSAFTDEHREAFKQVASRQLISLGYETDEAW